MMLYLFYLNLILHINTILRLQIIYDFYRCVPLKFAAHTDNCVKLLADISETVKLHLSDHLTGFLPLHHPIFNCYKTILHVLILTLPLLKLPTLILASEIFIAYLWFNVLMMGSFQQFSWNNHENLHYPCVIRLRLGCQGHLQRHRAYQLLGWLHRKHATSYQV